MSLFLSSVCCLVMHLCCTAYCCFQIQIDGVQHYLGVFDSERVAANKYTEKAAHVGGLGSCLGVITTSSTTLTSSACSEASITQAGTACNKADQAAMVGLGRTIRALAELNSELSDALKRTSDPGDKERCAYITAQIQEQLSIQAMYMMHIGMDIER